MTLAGLLVAVAAERCANCRRVSTTMSCASSAIGAADPSNYPAFMRAAVRAGLDRQSTMTTLGFRCAVTLS